MGDSGGPSAYRVIMSAVMAMTLVGALVGGVMLVTRVQDAARSPQVEFAIGPGPGVVVLRAIDEVGEWPFTESVAAEIGIDPVRLVLPPRNAIVAESASRRGSTADLLVANLLSPRLVYLRDAGVELDVSRVRAAIEQVVGEAATAENLLDTDGDGFDDDGRFTVTAVDGSSVCVSVGDRRALATALSLAVDPIDDRPSSGISWTTHGPCDTSTEPPLGTEVRVGTTPGTYGGVSTGEVCDAGLLVDRILTIPLVAESWAAVHSIDTRFVRDFVDALIPVVLLRDTIVTEYGFDNGLIHTRQVVLQRGTAVMVDRTGEPRVRCLSGAPLRRPHGTITEAVAVLGEPWRGFSLSTVADIPPGEVATSRFVLVDIRSGRPLLRDVADSATTVPSDGVVGAFDGG